MTVLHIRVYDSWIDRILKRIHPLGKLLTSLLSIFELSILEFFRRFDKKFHIYSMGFANRYILKGRWGGKVVPLNKNINVDTKFISTQEILNILERSNVVGISWCYCRTVQRKYYTPNCDNSLYTCIHLGSGNTLYEIPYKSLNLTKVSKNDISKLLEECDDNGLVHQLIYFPNPQFYYVVCNCCPCCCVVLNKFLKNGSPQMIKSDFIAKTDLNKCLICGKCEKWCYFGARIVVEGNLHFNSIKCFGCGICVPKCPNKAISLIKK